MISNTGLAVLTCSITLFSPTGEMNEEEFFVEFQQLFPRYVLLQKRCHYNYIYFTFYIQW